MYKKKIQSLEKTMLNKLFYKSLMILMIFISMDTLTFSKKVTIT